MSRFDNRSQKEFEKDIYFSTLLERYFFHEWLRRADKKRIAVSNPQDNGVDNTGRFVESGKTSGADYRVDITYGDFQKKGCPLEVKWVPTYGKLTLKLGDLKGYIKEGASILFIYNSWPIKEDLRKPADYNFENHIRKIEAVNQQIKWGIMTWDSLKKFFDYHAENNLFLPIKYMGNKPGVVLKQEDFYKWFNEEEWCI